MIGGVVAAGYGLLWWQFVSADDPYTSSASTTSAYTRGTSGYSSSASARCWKSSGW